jgi:hypothetical protein
VRAERSLIRGVTQNGVLIDKHGEPIAPWHLLIEPPVWQDRAGFSN